MFLFVGMNFGIDFAGGTQVDMRAKSGEAHVAEIRAQAESLGLGPVEGSGIGGESDVILRLNGSPAASPASRPQSPSWRDASSTDYEFRSRCGRPDRFERARPAARLASSSQSLRC